MRNVQITRTVDIALTADQWELYLGDEYNDREAVASQLNCDVAAAINSATDQPTAARAAEAVLAQPRYASYGADDTEGRYVLSRILREVFPGA